MRKPFGVSPRKCIFCGSRKKISREHIVPNWLKKVVPRVGEQHIHHGLRFIPQPNVKRGLGIAPFHREKQGNIGAATLFMVCANCNNGWMRDLQNELIPILTPLIKGDWTKFDETSASRMGMWMTMTATVIAMSVRDTLGVTREDRNHIHQTKTVPPNWNIWLGRASGFEDIVHSNRVGLVIDPLKGPIYGREPNTAVTTLVLGQLLLHSVSVPTADLMPHIIAYANDLGIFPAYPWGGREIDWRLIPIIHNDSSEFQRVKDDYHTKLMLPLFAQAIQ